jgi:tryptophanyl-tRNA synthetase
MVSVDLFTYPVLMAADILLYRTDRVPVGDDQRQHLELARNVAQRFNARYGEVLRVPEAAIPSTGGRVMDLQDPTIKMSTSMPLAARGVVRILDEPDTIRRKFKTAVTDPGREVKHDPAAKPGVSNLIEILTVATGESVEDVEARYDGQGYGAFKNDVAEAIVELLAPIQERYRELRADDRELHRLLAIGAEKARNASEPTLRSMYERMGFVMPASGRFFGAARPKGL